MKLRDTASNSSLIGVVSRHDTSRTKHGAFLTGNDRVSRKITPKQVLKKGIADMPNISVELIRTAAAEFESGSVPAERSSK